MLPPRQKERRDNVDHAGDALQRVAGARTRRSSTVEAAFSIILWLVYTFKDLGREACLMLVNYAITENVPVSHYILHLPAESKVPLGVKEVRHCF